MTTSSVSPVTTELAGSETGITLVIHAGAGSRGKHSTPERIAQVELDLQRALDAGYQLLESGAPAHEAVVAAIHVMEDAPEFNAGRGAALTSDGIAQMDACLMTGDGEVGAVTGVSTVKNPIDAARAVKEQTSMCCSRTRPMPRSPIGASRPKATSTSSPNSVVSPWPRLSPVAMSGRSMAPSVPWRAMPRAISPLARPLAASPTNARSCG